MHHQVRTLRAILQFHLLAIMNIRWNDKVSNKVVFGQAGMELIGKGK